MKDSLTEREAMKFMSLGCRKGLIANLPAEGKSLLWRAGDLRARWLLNHLAESVYVPHSHPECTAMSSLIHAERYLADRLAYELAPWPKNMVKDETINPLPKRCPHCTKIILEPNWCSVCSQKFCCLNCTLDHEHALADSSRTETK